MGENVKSDSKAERRAARAALGAYHEAELTKLIERLRDALGRLDAAEIDPFEFDDLVHHYKRAAQKLWVFCSGTGGHAKRVLKTLDVMRETGELPDWWAETERPPR